MAVPPLPAAVRGGELPAATKLQPHVLRLQPFAPTLQPQPHASQVESCLLCGASPYHRGTSCVEHRAAVAAAAGAASEEERARN